MLDQITLKCNRFGFEPEVTAKIAKIRPRLRIYEVGVAYYGRSYEEGKKITWKDGVKAILTIVRFGFSKLTCWSGVVRIPSVSFQYAGETHFAMVK